MLLSFYLIFDQFQSGIAFKSVAYKSIAYKKSVNTRNGQDGSSPNFASNINPLNANLTKWSNILEQLFGNLPTNCLNVFDHFVGLEFKW